MPYLPLDLNCVSKKTDIDREAPHRCLAQAEGGSYARMNRTELVCLVLALMEPILPLKLKQK